MQKEPRLNSQPERELDVLILAAGLGKRMKSRQAKVLHQLSGRPLIAHVCRAAQSLNPRRIYVVVGHQGEKVGAAVREELDEDQAALINQSRQLGTGDAVMSARSALQDAESMVLILSGDVPLVRTETLRSFVEAHRSGGSACTILSVKMENPTGYGRIVRDEEGSFRKIVEQKDASADERQIREINSGIYCFDTAKLFTALERVEPTNQQAEYYLTDVPAILLSDGEPVNVYLHSDAREVAGVNTRADLAEFENLLRRNAIRRLMLDDGV